MAFGYVADFSTGSQNSMGIRQHAEALLVNLRNNRPKELVSHPKSKQQVTQTLCRQNDHSRSYATASEDSLSNR
jgi:hypothetical protein